MISVTMRGALRISLSVHCRHTLLAATCLAAIFGSTFSVAWETDVHYGLTTWLALQAGFSEKDAEEIGNGTQMFDKGPLKPLHLGAWACYGHDRGSLYEIGQRHFPSPNYAPSKPHLREVKPGGEIASKTVSRGIDDKLVPAMFGPLLHPLQDSWSHQGVPGELPFCSSDFSYSHPSKRGGWWRHKADLTFEFPGDAVQTARATYEVLRAYRRALDRDSLPREWSKALEVKVLAFANSKTLLEKWRWFNAQGFKDPTRALDGISLPFGSEEMEAKYSYRTGLVSANGDPILIGDGEQLKSLRTTVDDLLKQWVAQARRGKLSGRSNWWQKFVDEKAFLENLKRRHGAASPDDIEILFNMWLAADHGMVERAGHGTPGKLGDIRKALETLKPIKSEAFSEALLADGPGHPPYVLASETTVAGDGSITWRKDGAALFLRFRHAPSDSVVVSFKRSSAGWQIVDLTWVIDQ